jgi:hypothetical protein
VKRGFVLPGILFASLLLAAVIGGVWAAAWQSVRLARAAAAETRSRAAAAGSLHELLAEWDAARFNALAAGESDSLRFTRGPLEHLIVVKRASALRFILTARVRGESESERTVVIHARLAALAPAPEATARLRYPPSTEAGAVVHGADEAPVGWDCDPDSAIVSIHISDTDSMMSLIDDFWDFDRLADWASRQSLAGDSLPWRYHAGDLVLDGERFTGVLVVGGNLIVRGGAEVVGVVIVRDTIAFEWRGGAIVGRAVSRALRVAAGLPAGSAKVGNSSCAARHAGRSRAPAVALAGVPAADRY